MGRRDFMATRAHAFLEGHVELWRPENVPVGRGSPRGRSLSMKVLGAPRFVAASHSLQSKADAHTWLCSRGRSPQGGGTAGDMALQECPFVARIFGTRRQRLCLTIRSQDDCFPVTPHDRPINIFAFVRSRFTDHGIEPVRQAL